MVRSRSLMIVGFRDLGACRIYLFADESKWNSSVAVSQNCWLPVQERAASIPVVQSRSFTIVGFRDLGACRIYLFAAKLNYSRATTMIQWQWTVFNSDALVVAPDCSWWLQLLECAANYWIVEFCEKSSLRRI